MTPEHLVLHGIAIKRHATTEDVSNLVGLDLITTESIIQTAIKSGRVLEFGEKVALTPAATMILNSEYSKLYTPFREKEDFLRAIDEFEKLNNELKSLITSWQIKKIGGEEVPNDHSDREYDSKIIARLGDLHEKFENIIDKLSSDIGRLNIYKKKLLKALEKAEDGDIQWVSDAKIESYHTIWFELHEDLLRICGRDREE